MVYFVVAVFEASAVSVMMFGAWLIVFAAVSDRMRLTVFGAGARLTVFVVVCVASAVGARLTVFVIVFGAGKACLMHFSARVDVVVAVCVAGAV